MIDALIAGHLYGGPVERETTTGKRYATAKVRVSTRAGDSLFCNVIAFDGIAVSALLALGDGDSVAIAGELTPKVYTAKDGTARPVLDLLAHAVLTPFAVQRKRRAVREPDATSPADQPFNDELPGAA
jgi:single-stranded DNA-binding protein